MVVKRKHISGISCCVLKEPLHHSQEGRLGQNTRAAASYSLLPPLLLSLSKDVAVKGCVDDNTSGLSSPSTTSSGGGLFLLPWQDLRQEVAVPLDIAACSVEMDARVVVLDFFSDLGYCCGRKGGTKPSLGHSMQLNPSSQHGAGGGGGAC
jgi:hypothetical protein